MPITEGISPSQAARHAFCPRSNALYNSGLRPRVLLKKDMKAWMGIAFSEAMEGLNKQDGLKVISLEGIIYNYHTCNNTSTIHTFFP